MENIISVGSRNHSGKRGKKRDYIERDSQEISVTV